MQTSWCRSSFVGAALLACAEAPAPARQQTAPPPARPAAAPREAAAPEATAPGAAAPARRDSTWVEVTGPTLIAFYPPNAAALIDSAGDAATALDDFGFHLASATDSLRTLGVRVTSIGSRTLHVVSDGATTVFRVPPNSVDLGYYFVAPGRPARVEYGARTDADLIDAAREHLLGMRAGTAAARPAP